MKTDRLTIAGTAYASRLIVGTGKYPTFEVMRRAIEASGASLVTVAVRRVDLARRDGESLLDHLDLE
ncbi:MAG TPA: thiazole synthase, partial [Candidatus Binatia bacterium]|nr:thiazole synthase [Candidatus Binatia bacterium]